MFDKAARMKLRFDFKGQCSTEDLWDLTVEELDQIFKRLNKILKEQKGESLLEKKNTYDEVLELKITIIKHIVKIKLDEQKVREDEILRKEKKQKLLSILSEKQDEKYRKMSASALQKLVDEL